MSVTRIVDAQSRKPSRISIDVSDDVHAALKIEAARRRISMKQLIMETLERQGVLQAAGT